MRRRAVVLLALAAVLAVLTTAVVRHRGREHEWRHGGDSFRATATAVATTAAGFEDARAAIGAPRDLSGPLARRQVLLHVRWTAPTLTGGHFQLLGLDERFGLGYPMSVRASTAGGLGWDGRYDVLGEHYPWLAMTGEHSTDDPGVRVKRPADLTAASVPATSTGEVFLLLPLAALQEEVGDPAGRLTLAVWATDADGEVRWAARVPVTAAG